MKIRNRILQGGGADHQPLAKEHANSPDTSGFKLRPDFGIQDTGSRFSRPVNPVNPVRET